MQNWARLVTPRGFAEPDRPTARGGLGAGESRGPEGSPTEVLQTPMRQGFLWIATVTALQPPPIRPHRRTPKTHGSQPARESGPIKPPGARLKAQGAGRRVVQHARRAGVCVQTMASAVPIPIPQWGCSWAAPRWAGTPPQQDPKTRRPEGR